MREQVKQLRKQELYRSLNKDREGQEAIKSYQKIYCNESFVLRQYYPIQLNLYNAAYNDSIVSAKRINDCTRINKYFESINDVLKKEDKYIGFAQNLSGRNKELKKKCSGFLYRVLLILDFIINRVIPKVSFTKKLYFALRKKVNRPLSSAELFGRLVSCGFEIIDYHDNGKHTVFVAKKIDEPDFNFSPTYGPIIKLKRYGENNELINVYKLRTMHPYSEYLQDFIYKKNDLSDNGKFKNDFRITPWAKFLRKCWLDEIPMLINLFKGDLKLIGVRPISRQYFNLYPEKLKNLRKMVKPGLVPPFYADMPDSLDEIISSEIRYIESYLKNPWKTDFLYLLAILKNIFFNKARSK